MAFDEEEQPDEPTERELSTREALTLLREISAQQTRLYRVTGDSNWALIAICVLLAAIAVKLWFFT